MKTLQNIDLELPEKDNKAVYLLSLGGAETVTGSKHLLVTPVLNILIDCGLFQGIKSLREKNREFPPVNPASIDAVILTHAHLGHCGYIPLLIKNGYRGKIYMSLPTRDLAELVLRDSAKLQEEDAKKANQYGYSKHKPAKPLYDTADVEAALPYFEIVGKEELCILNDKVQFRLYPAGHIPGACSVKIGCFGKTIVFSGDVGRYNSALLPPPSHPANADFVVMESTYGDHLHEGYNIAERLAFVINETILDGGNILIPCFAAGRAQEILLLLDKLKSSKEIPAAIPVFFDSPIAASLRGLLLEYPGWMTVNGEEISQALNGVIINEDARGTEKIIQQPGSKIILAGTDMLTGGRALEYLKHYGTELKNTILFIGYQAEGTRGRALLNKTHEIKIHGHYYPANVNVTEIGSLSGHADQSELIRWLREFKNKPSHVYLVHGEPGAQQSLRVKIKDELNLDVSILKQDKFELLFNTIAEMANL